MENNMVYHLLLTSVEGMTLGAHLDADVLLGGTGLDHIAAGAPNRGLLVVRMDAFLHLYSPLSPWRIVSHNATDIIPQGKGKCNCFLKKIIFWFFAPGALLFIYCLSKIFPTELCALLMWLKSFPGFLC